MASSHHESRGQFSDLELETWLPERYILEKRLDSLCCEPLLNFDGMRIFGKFLSFGLRIGVRKQNLHFVILKGKSTNIEFTPFQERTIRRAVRRNHRTLSFGNCSSEKLLSNDFVTSRTCKTLCARDSGESCMTLEDTQ